MPSSEANARFAARSAGTRSVKCEAAREDSPPPRSSTTGTFVMSRRSVACSPPVHAMSVVDVHIDVVADTNVVDDAARRVQRDRDRTLVRSQGGRQRCSGRGEVGGRQLRAGIHVPHGGALAERGRIDQRSLGELALTNVVDAKCLCARHDLAGRALRDVARRDEGARRRGPLSDAVSVARDVQEHRDAGDQCGHAGEG